MLLVESVVASVVCAGSVFVMWSNAESLHDATADVAGIQYRILNKSKGPAVQVCRQLPRRGLFLFIYKFRSSILTQGPRAQIDRELYRTAVRRDLLQVYFFLLGYTVTSTCAPSLMLAQERVYYCPPSCTWVLYCWVVWTSLPHC